MNKNDKEEFYKELDKSIDGLYSDFERHCKNFDYDIDINKAQEFGYGYTQLAIKHLFLISFGFNSSPLAA